MGSALRCLDLSWPWVSHAIESHLTWTQYAGGRLVGKNACDCLVSMMTQLIGPLQRIICDKTSVHPISKPILDTLVVWCQPAQKV